MAIFITHKVIIGYLGYEQEVVLDVGVGCLDGEFFCHALGVPNEDAPNGIEAFATTGIMDAIQEIVDEDQTIQDYARVRLYEAHPEYAQALAA